jgi:pimeloyl-ACP methyl ester carboxylesterase
MVMVDCSHPDQIARLLEVLGPKRAGEPASLATLRQVITDPSVPDEQFDFGTSAAQVRATGALLSIPLVVLTAGNHQFPKALEAAWRGMQEELAGLSSESVHVLIPNSGHFIQEEYPQPVIVAVNEVVMAVRTHQRLASCTQTFPTLGGVCFPGL